VDHFTNPVQRAVVLRARFPFDFFAALSHSGQALAPLVKTWGFGMTPHDAEVGSSMASLALSG
jgi:hypothetical protein